MLRIILTVLLPIALPLLLYLAYMKYRPRPAPGADPGAREDNPAFWIALGVSVLVVAGMVALGLGRGVPPGTQLIAPHMENGTIVPSQRLEPAR